MPADQISWLDKLVARMESMTNLASLKEMTVHRYQARDFLQTYDGPLSALEFTREKLEELIAHGYRDAIAHDCEQEGCYLPDATNAST